MAANKMDTDKKRFSSLNGEQFQQLIIDKDAKNTKKATAFAINAFQAYLKEKNEDEQFDSMTKAKLDGVLAKFYAEARQENGTLYKRTSLCSLRHGLNRHFSAISGGAALSR